MAITPRSYKPSNNQALDPTDTCKLAHVGSKRLPYLFTSIHTGFVIGHTNGACTFTGAIKSVMDFERSHIAGVAIKIGGFPPADVIYFNTDDLVYVVL